MYLYLLLHSAPCFILLYFYHFARWVVNVFEFVRPYKVGTQPILSILSLLCHIRIPTYTDRQRCYPNAKTHVKLNFTVKLSYIWEFGKEMLATSGCDFADKTLFQHSFKVFKVRLTRLYRIIVCLCVCVILFANNVSNKLFNGAPLHHSKALLAIIILKMWIR